MRVSDFARDVVAPTLLMSQRCDIVGWGGGVREGPCFDQSRAVEQFFRLHSV